MAICPAECAIGIHFIINRKFFSSTVSPSPGEYDGFRIQAGFMNRFSGFVFPFLEDSIINRPSDRIFLHLNIDLNHARMDLKFPFAGIRIHEGLFVDDRKCRHPININPFILIVEAGT